MKKENLLVLLVLIAFAGAVALPGVGASIQQKKENEWRQMKTKLYEKIARNIEGQYLIEEKGCYKTDVIYIDPPCKQGYFAKMVIENGNGAILFCCPE